MKNIPFIPSALVALLLVSGCESVPEPKPAQRTAREAATDQGQAVSRESSTKLADDAATSATSRSR